MSNSDGFTTQQQAAAVLAERWQRAWNRHRMESAADLLAPEADFVNVVGHWMRGRSQFLEHHVRLHQMQMRDSRWTNLSLTLRTHSEKLALAHLEWRIEGDRDPDGQTRAPRRGLFTWVIAFDGATAVITAAHNTNVLPAHATELLNPATTEGN
ncbi:SgcJ/EcaC family oxidoreductase [Polaromonas sp. P1(28)-8]|nr:SgcJ/EcaC family oxidoreductase [Polaromonas sp. P1(28)-8]